MNAITSKDLQLFYWLFGQTQNRSTRWIRALSKTGDGPLYAASAFILLIFAQQGEDFVIAGLTAFAIELPLYFVAKNTFKRNRPSSAVITAHITPSDKFSLPSGHTSAAFLMAMLISHFWPSLAVVVYLWATLIGISRVLLGVHYPSDIILGAMLGSFSAWTVLAIL